MEKTTRKGRYHYKPVVALNEDGTLYKRFPSVTAAGKFFHLYNNAQVRLSCHGKGLCRGYKLMYEEDYVPFADCPRGRDSRGLFLKGYCHKVLCKDRSPETSRRCAEQARERSMKMLADPNCRWGKSNKKKPVMCVETGEEFDSLKECGDKMNITPNQISRALKLRRKTHGYSFKFLKKEND